MRDVGLLLVLTVAATLVTYGVAWYSHGAGFVVGGMLLAVLGWLVLGEVDSGADE